MGDKAAKQKYLKEQIIDKGFDTENFGDFMNSKKEDGLNIQLWTFDELVAAVEEYQMYYSQGWS